MVKKVIKTKILRSLRKIFARFRNETGPPEKRIQVLLVKKNDAKLRVKVALFNYLRPNLNWCEFKIRKQKDKGTMFF